MEEDTILEQYFRERSGLWMAASAAALAGGPSGLAAVQKADQVLSSFEERFIKNDGDRRATN